MNKDSQIILQELAERLETSKGQLDDIASFDIQLTTRQRGKIISLIQSTEQMMLVVRGLIRRRTQ